MPLHTTYRIDCVATTYSPFFHGVERCATPLRQDRLDDRQHPRDREVGLRLFKDFGARLTVFQDILSHGAKRGAQLIEQRPATAGFQACHPAPGVVPSTCLHFLSDDNGAYDSGDSPDVPSWKVREQQSSTYSWRSQFGPTRHDRSKRLTNLTNRYWLLKTPLLIRPGTNAP